MFLALAVTVAYAPANVHAQFTIPGAQSALIISLSPAHPEPNTSVELLLQSPLYDLTQSDIIWTVNGKVVAHDFGLRKLQLQTGDAGSSLDVSVDITADNGIASANIRVSPSSVDLLWEADSYVPPFYKGRALPSAGSSVTLVAVPHLTRSNGSEVAPGDITYTWKKDGEELASASGRGKASVRIAGPLLYGSDVVSVEAISSADELSGSATIRIADIEPELTLYEVHPLYGTLYHNALGPTTFISEVEMSFAAIPYFASVRSPADAGLEYLWKVNDQAIVPEASEPNALTINAEKSSGLALIRLVLTHATNFYLNLDSAWRLTFTKGGIPTGANDPFRQ
jgi:hypothetical protein